MIKLSNLKNKKEYRLENEQGEDNSFVQSKYNFKNIMSFPPQYAVNPSVWMISTVFGKYIRNWGRRLEKQVGIPEPGYFRYKDFMFIYLRLMVG